MRKNLEDRFTMFYAADQALENHNAVWAALVPFAAAVTQFRTKITDIEAESEKQQKELDGYAMDKIAKKTAMIDKALSISAQVFAYAEDTSNVILREKMNLSRSDLGRPRDAVVAQLSKSVHDEANAVLASLAPYGIVAADLTALLTAIDAYEAVISSPRTAVTIRKGATEDIEVLIKEGTTILANRIDKMMEEYRVSNPDFFQEYFNARIVVDTGSHAPAVPVPPGP